MSGFDVIRKTISDHRDLIEFLTTHGEVSHMTAVESALPKIVLLSAASDLEMRTQELIIKFFEERTTSHEFAVSFVRNKAINRQFHTYFDWKGRSANPFFSLFGQSFKRKILDECDHDPQLKSAVRAFCEVGALRNELVHTNYATYTVNMTANEVFTLYESSLYFLNRLDQILCDNLE